MQQCSKEACHLSCRQHRAQVSNITTSLTVTFFLVIIRRTPMNYARKDFYVLCHFLNFMSTVLLFCHNSSVYLSMCHAYPSVIWPHAHTLTHVYLHPPTHTCTLPHTRTHTRLICKIQLCFLSLTFVFNLRLMELLFEQNRLNTHARKHTPTHTLSYSHTIHKFPFLHSPDEHK